MIKKIFTHAKSTKVKINNNHHNQTQSSSDFFTNKPFILKEVQSKSEIETYRQLRNIFRNNHTVTYTMLQDLAMLDDVMEEIIYSKFKTNMRKQNPKAYPYRTKIKRSREQRKAIRSLKMWVPE